eukprot:TRINITY_DN10170_c0_g1_i6.p1 TRINITY_DN10170_c0_g1~~TRINITY_DN10170_c0_g1_i6.p1  ORF type:complete len:624 (+),score=106.75 TRINITY_DN10170_c0_g1_i6:61-1932(+)
MHAVDSSAEATRVLLGSTGQKVHPLPSEFVTSDDDDLSGVSMIRTNSDPCRLLLLGLKRDLAKLASDVQTRLFQQEVMLKGLHSGLLSPPSPSISKQMQNSSSHLTSTDQGKRDRLQSSIIMDARRRAVASASDPDSCMHLTSGRLDPQRKSGHSSKSHASDESGHADMQPQPSAGTSGSYLSHTSSVRSEAYSEVLARVSESLRLDMEAAQTIHAWLDETSGWRQQLASFFDSPKYFMLIGLLVFSNAILVGLQVDSTAAQNSDESYDIYFATDVAYTVMFLVDVLLKLAAFGVVHFCYRDRDRIWNLLDCVVVAVSLSEPLLKWLALSKDDSFSNATVLRVFRLARLARAIRIIRLFKFVQPLRTLILSISSTMKSVFWAFVLVTAVNYVVSIILAQATADFCRDSIEVSSMSAEACRSHVSMTYWSSVATSMLSLFQVSTQGIGWSSTFHALAEIGPVSQILLLLYVFFMYFVILNTITGVFCSTAIEAASRDEDISILQHVAQKEAHMNALRKLFQEQEGTSSWCFSLEALERLVQNPQARVLFEAMDMAHFTPRVVFDLIDIERKGYLHIEDLVSGCMQLRGVAKAMQLADLSLRHRKVEAKLDALRRDVQGFRAELM